MVFSVLPAPDSPLEGRARNERFSDGRGDTIASTGEGKGKRGDGEKDKILCLLTLRLLYHWKDSHFCFADSLSLCYTCTPSKRGAIVKWTLTPVLNECLYPEAATVAK